MTRRKDSKGRLLRDGEIQRPDGKYEYRYYDQSRQRRSVYSWKLVDNDTVPKGKRSAPALRSLEEQINQASVEQIDFHLSQHTTVEDCVDRYLGLKFNTKPTTKMSQEMLMNRAIRPLIGKIPVSELHYSDVKTFYWTLVRKKGWQIGSLSNVNGVLQPAMKMAIRDGLIRMNPVDGVLQEIHRETGWVRPKRHALTPKQQEALIHFVANSNSYKRWLPMLMLLLGTGLRIGEALALRWEDCDFQHKVIHVDKTVEYVRIDGKWKHYISRPKTEAGIRDVPMLETVKQALLAQKAMCLMNGFCTDEIDGYRDFIFHTRTGRALTPHSVDHTMRRLRIAYNKQEEQRAAKENRAPELMPPISPHVMRHTFCTRFCEVEKDIKVIQKIMGHSKAAVTMDVYNEVNDGREMSSLEKMEAVLAVDTF